MPSRPGIGDGRVFTPKSKEALRDQYRKDEEFKARVQLLKIPFINPEISDGLVLSQGLVLLGGVSGKGKSTLASNIVAGFLAHANQTSQALVITNEESVGAVYNRIACCLLGVNFFAFNKGQAVSSVVSAVRGTAEQLVDRVTVVDDDAFDMTCLEDVVAVLEYAAKGPVGIVVLDYFQTVAYSRTNPDLDLYGVLKKLGLYLKDYGRRVGVPILAFAQLRTQPQDNKSKQEFKDRVEGDRTIYNHAYQAIEIIPDFPNRTTQFVVVKDRFGYNQGKVIQTRFVDGRFETMEGL